MKTFFKKLAYSFLLETTKIENTSFLFKTALSEVSVKTNRMATTKWTYHKEWSFAYSFFITSLASNYLTTFLEISFQSSNLLNRTNLIYQRPKRPYRIFRKR